MGPFWPCQLFERLRKRKQRRATDVTCETLFGVEPGNSVTYKKNAWRKKKPNRLGRALSRLRDAYVDLMVYAADRGDISTLVYGNGYCGREFRFDSSYFIVDDLSTSSVCGSSQRSSSS